MYYNKLITHEIFIFLRKKVIHLIIFYGYFEDTIKCIVKSIKILVIITNVLVVLTVSLLCS